MIGFRGGLEKVGFEDGINRELDKGGLVVLVVWV